MTELTIEQLLDPQTVATLLRDAPEGGVLSVYVDADTGADPGLQGAAIDIRNRLAELRRNSDAEGPSERAAAVGDALERLGPEIARLTSPRERGRGRVLLASLGGRDVTRFASQ